jgi:hypothetical protein
MTVPNFAPSTAPSYGSSRQLRFVSDPLQFEAGYSQIRKRTIRPLRPFDLIWELASEADKDYIESFIDGLDGAPGPFTWTPFNKVAVPSGITSTLTQVAGGALGSRTYYVTFTWYDAAAGETTESARASLAVDASKYIVVTIPTAVPTGIDGWRLYISETSGSEKLEATVTDSRQWTQSAALTGTEDPPSSNTLLPTTKRYIFNGDIEIVPVAFNLWNIRLSLLEQFF